MNQSHWTKYPIRIAEVALIASLVATACGSSAATPVADAGAAGADTATTTIAEVVVDTAAVNAWLGEIDGFLTEFAADTSEVLFDHNAAIQTDDSVTPWIEHLESSAAVYDRYADRVDSVPEGTPIEVAAATYASHFRGSAESLRTAAGELETDPALQESLTGSAFDTVVTLVFGGLDGARERVDAACFPFQEAAVDAGFALIDCVGSSEEPVAPVSQEDGSPLLTVGSYDRVDAGTYTTEGFARPITITFDEPMRIEVNPHDIELAPVGDEGQLAFWIVAPDDLPVPGTPYGNIGDTVPFPESLGAWLEQIPVEISDSGVTQVGGVDVPFWTVPLPADAATEGVDIWVFADFDDGPQLFPLREGATLWQVPHPDGPLVLYGQAKYEIPGAPGLSEITTFMESILSTIVVPDSPSKTTADDTPPPDDTEPPVVGDSSLDEIRTAMMNLQGAQASIWSPLPETISVGCEDPPFESEDFEVAPTWVGYGTDTGNVELWEFTEAADRDAWVALNAEVRPGCVANGPMGLESAVIDTEAGEFLTLSVILVIEGEVVDSFVSHSRVVGATGMLLVDSQSVEGVDALLTDLGFG